MAAEKREKIKLMIVIGLSVVFVTIAYFRFMSQKESSAVAAPAASAADPQVAIPRVEIKNHQIDPAPTSSDVIRRRFVKRDIFTPMNIPIPLKVKKKPVAQKPSRKPPPEPTSLPSLKLKGTIVGGEGPIAIVNDTFLRTGDEIAGFKVVWIGTKAIVMEAGERKFALEMLKVE